MEKIYISKEQLTTLIKLQSELSAYDLCSAEPTTGENLMRAEEIARNSAFDLSDLQDALTSTGFAIRDKNINGIIKNMAQYVKLMKTIKEDMQIIENHLAASVSKFLEVTELYNGLELVATDDEIQNALDDGFEQFPVMSVGYKDGIFALLFGEDENSIDIEPFVFAKGTEENFDEAEEYIESFIDIDEVIYEDEFEDE